MNRKNEERRKAAKTRRRREERRRARWESYPQRILRLVDEDLPFDQMADRVSMEVLRARPSPEDGQELYAEYSKWIDRSMEFDMHMRRLRTTRDNPTGETFEAMRKRIHGERRVLEYALIETAELLEGEEQCRESQG